MKQVLAAVVEILVQKSQFTLFWDLVQSTSPHPPPTRKLKFGQFPYPPWIPSRFHISFSSTEKIISQGPDFRRFSENLAEFAMAGASLRKSMDRYFNCKDTKVDAQKNEKLKPQ